jgi:hypothetical protein
MESNEPLFFFPFNLAPGTVSAPSGCLLPQRSGPYDSHPHPRAEKQCHEVINTGQNTQEKEQGF